MRKPFVAYAFTLSMLGACGGGAAPSDPTPDVVDTVDAPATPVDAAPGNLGALAGTITRSATPQGDARGHVYVALFDRDPVVNQASAQVVARARVEDADLSGAAAQLAYTLPDIPPRAEDYYLVAFLDDNGNVDPNDAAGAGPDRGDLVSLDGLAAPKVAVTSSGSQPHDIDLNSVLPF